MHKNSDLKAMLKKVKTTTIIKIGNAIGTLLLLLAFILGFFRQQLFGVIPGYAPHNFAFNVILIFPLVFFSLLICFIVVIVINVKWKNLNLKYKIFGSLPFYLFLFYLVFQFIWILRQH